MLGIGHQIEQREVSRQGVFQDDREDVRGQAQKRHSRKSDSEKEETERLTTTTPRFALRAHKTNEQALPDRYFVILAAFVKSATPQTLPAERPLRTDSLVRSRTRR